MQCFNNPNSTAGKMTVSILIVGFVVFAVLFLFDFEHKQAIQRVAAQDSATTTVTVINTPPEWTVDVAENPESSTSSPTNATSTVSWTAIGTDSNAEDYWLIVCRTGSNPIANADAPPTCDGGSGNLWGISPTTTSGTQATATYTTLVSDAELNDWWGTICDANPTDPRCNLDIQQGTGDSGSPFHVNHRPSFTLLGNDGPADPGALITWFSTSSDPDVLSGDGVFLYVCRTADFDYSTPECAGGFSNTWATSSSVWVQDVEASSTVIIPTQDDTYDAFGYVVDVHGFAALDSGGSSTNTPTTVNNVTPTISPSSINLNFGDDIILTTENGETVGFSVAFTVTDNNSCVANASTTSEFDWAAVSVFRTGVGSTSCDTAAEFNTNNCYNSNVITDLWNYTDAVATSTNSCAGPTDTTQAYEFIFPLWYNADPTDGSDLTDSTWFGEEWGAAVQAQDDNLASSTNATSSTGVDLLSFLAFDLNTLSIPYGSIAPGGTTSPITATTTIQATGNVGLDEGLDGEDMCTDYTTFDSCFDPSPLEPTSTILVSQQVYATASVAYTDPQVFTLSDSSTQLELDVPKTTVTTTPETGDTIWGIAIPVTINFSGVYTGQNTFTAIKGEAQQW